MSESLSFLTADGGHCPRVMIVSPHPDDEVLGAGTRLPLLRNTLVVQVTDGAPADMTDAFAAGCSSRSSYAALRSPELRNALALCGRFDTVELEIPDQQAACQLVALTRTLEHVVSEFSPEYLITVPYEGGHPDHDATAFAVHQACARLAVPPTVVEMLSYHNENGCCVMDRFLEEDSSVLTVRLNLGEIAFKQRLFDCFPSQARVLRWFKIEVEKFRVAPRYDFAQPPHAGQLYYEMFPWGMTNARWCELARGALGEADALLV